MKVKTGYFKKDPDWMDDCYYVANASKMVVDMIIRADENSNDGRSQWVYIRLSSGDLVLATYPQGETYLATESDRDI